MGKKGDNFFDTGHLQDFEKGEVNLSSFLGLMSQYIRSALEMGDFVPDFYMVNYLQWSLSQMERAVKEGVFDREILAHEESRADLLIEIETLTEKLRRIVVLREEIRRLWTVVGASKIFHNESDFHKWLEQPNYGFEGMSPIAKLRSESPQDVEKLIVGLLYGLLT